MYGRIIQRALLNTNATAKRQNRDIQACYSQQSLRDDQETNQANIYTPKSMQTCVYMVYIYMLDQFN